MKRTKIVCTMGPKTENVELLKEMIKSGMNVARFNFSHGSHEEHAGRMALVEEARKAVNIPVATMLDTKGPEIRTGSVPGDKKVTLVEGQDFDLTIDQSVETTQKSASITYEGLVADAEIGCRILIDDGLIELKVISKDETALHCTVVNGGELGSKKGVNVPNVKINLPGITEKDKKDILFGIDQGFDFIAASFVRNAACIEEIRDILNIHGSRMRIIAKIESAEGIENIDEILQAADGIMVARGDLGVEIPAELVPHIQKTIIDKCNEAQKPVITATQMLDSMIRNPRPTRAEVTDVANAIYDGTSAIMLSGETAAGMYPIEALKTMVRIAVRTEQDINYLQRFKMRKTMSNPDVTNAISHATCTMAGDLNAAAIITVTKSGRTARMVSKYRPNCPIIGGCLTEKIYRQLALSWGVIPLMIEEKTQAEELFDYAVDAAEAAGIISKGDVVVLTAGVPLGVSGTTNLIKVQVAGHILVEGQRIGTQKISANLCVCHSDEDLKNFKVGDIIVAKDTSNAMMPQMREASGLIVEASGENCHAAIAGLSLDIPVLIGAKHALDVLKSSAYVELDCENGLVTAN